MISLWTQEIKAIQIKNILQNEQQNQDSKTRIKEIPK